MTENIPNSHELINDSFKSKYRVQRYKTKPSKTMSISSGSLILSIGLGTGLSIHAMFLPFNMAIFGFDIVQDFGIAGVLNLLTFLFSSIIFDPFTLISYFLIGFFIGGFFASLVYKMEGKKGPLYSIILSFSITISITFILGMISLNNAEYGSLSNIFAQLMVLIITSLIFSLIVIPMSIMAWLGFKIGIYFGAG